MYTSWNQLITKNTQNKLAILYTNAVLNMMDKNQQSHCNCTSHADVQNKIVKLILKSLLK